MLTVSLERKVAERTKALDEANERLSELSGTDPLTGLANRRQLGQVLERQWRHAQATGRSIAVAMVDIDNFKEYNDRYGHPAGDRCLRRVASVLNENVRATDVVARYGGEEFVIVMPGIDLTAAARIAQRIRLAVAALDQPHERSPFEVVTISVGVAAAVPSDTASPEHLVGLADSQLYAAKRAGRNQVAFV